MGRGGTSPRTGGREGEGGGAPVLGQVDGRGGGSPRTGGLVWGVYVHLSLAKPHPIGV